MKGRGRRLGLLLGAGLAHAVLLAWLNLQTPRGAGLGDGPFVTVGLFSADSLNLGPAAEAPVVETPAEASASAADTPTEVLDPPAPVDSPFFTEAPPAGVRFDADPKEVGPQNVAVASSAGGGNKDACQLSEQLQSTLQNDPGVRAAVARIPADARSVANAVMLWNGRWAEHGESTTFIRARIDTYVRAASSPCREGAKSGPLFLFIAGEPKTTVLVLGSGVWRWSDLLADRPDQSTEAARSGAF